MCSRGFGFDVAIDEAAGVRLRAWWIEAAVAIVIHGLVLGSDYGVSLGFACGNVARDLKSYGTLVRAGMDGLMQRSALRLFEPISGGGLLFTDEVEKKLVDARVLGKLGVESCG